MSKTYPYDENCIAVTGMAARLPGADTIQEFWENLVAGRQSMEPIPDEILAAGLHAQLRHEPDYVAMRSTLRDFDLFDAEFFGFSPRDASIMDPQHRLVLEYAWRAFENAGYVPEDTGDTRTGVFASSDMSGYLTGYLYYHILSGALDVTEAVIGCDKDYLATRIAYKCNFHGPAMAVQSSCSSSLLSVHVACQSLLAGDCDRALVTACTVMLPENLGYIYLPGGMRSPDGRCRPYDAAANGTIFGNGVLAVLLKRLDDALRDRDNILAVVRATAATNDGWDKVGYTAPSISGQALAITSALDLAGVDPADVDFVEGHGTATPLGDPIEIAALRQAYGPDAPAGDDHIVLGSLKGNIGHLDAAAGLASFAKASLCLHHRLVPGTANFERPNPTFGGLAPFRISSTNVDLPEEGSVLGGVSAFGIGGTNVHVLVQSAPERPKRPDGTLAPERLPLVFSAHNEEAFEKTRQALRAYFLKQTDKRDARDTDAGHAETGFHFADAAATMALGRKAQPFRGCVTALSAAEAAEGLQEDLVPQYVQEKDPGLAFLFPGQGNLHPTMARSFLENEKDFRLRFQKLAALCRQAQGPDLEALLRGCWAGEKKALCALCETQTAQPLLFALELALATTLVERGVRPDCLMGHSLGEYTAACLAGVFSPEDGMRLVTLRGALMQKAPRGRMLVVSLHHSRVREVLGSAFAGVEISLVNSAANCVLTGDEEALERCAQAVAEHGQRATFLKTSHAFHSASMEGIMDDFGTLVSSFTLHEPKLPIVSNLTGTWAGAEMAQPDYWVRHLRSTVQFAKGLATLRTRAALGLEAGSGNVLRSLATQVPGDKLRVIPGLDALKTGSGQAERGLADIAAECWQNGAAIDWEAYFAPYEPYRCPMPETAFTPRRYWIAPGAVQAVQVAGGAQGSLLADHHEKTGADSGMEKYARTCRTAYEAPEGEVERLLVGLWEELLFVDHIGVCDDFVELGGNSIQVMQMVRAAAGLGLSFTSKDVFEAGTIRKLTLRARSGAAARTASPGPVPVPPYLEGRLARGQDGLARCCVLACPKGFDMADAGRLARALARAHDALRMAWSGTALRLAGASESDWGQNNVESMGPIPMVDGQPDRALLEQECLRLAQGLQPERLKAWSLGLSQESEPPLLALLVHTGICDERSMELLQGDVAAFLQGREALEEGPSWKLWLEDLADGSADAQPDQPAQTGQPEQAGQAVQAGQTDLAWAAPCTQAECETLQCTLPPETAAALAEAARRCRTTVEELALAAVSLCLAEDGQKWPGWPDRSDRALFCRNDGRHLKLPGARGAGLVGSLALYLPLPLPEEGDAASAIVHVKKYRRSLVQQGTAPWLAWAGQEETVPVVTFAGPEGHGSAGAAAAAAGAGPAKERSAGRCLGSLLVSPGERPCDSLASIRLCSGAQGLQLVVHAAPGVRERIAALQAAFPDRAARIAEAGRTSPAAQRYIVEEFPDSELTQADLDIILSQLCGASQ